jgi:hypothetical protein
MDRHIIGEALPAPFVVRATGQAGKEILMVRENAIDLQRLRMLLET